MNFMILEIFKNFNFFDKNFIIRTGKSAMLLMKKMWFGHVFAILWFSSSSGGFCENEMIFLRNPMVWPIKFYKISHNSTQNSSNPCRKKIGKFRKKNDEFWSILRPKNDENWTKKLIFFFSFSNFETIYFCLSF